MYGQMRGSVGAVGGAASGILPFTGASVLWWLITGLILITAGITAMSLVPKRQR
jgi:hypothetical protein